MIYALLATFSQSTFKLSEVRIKNNWFRAFLRCYCILFLMASHKALFRFVVNFRDVEQTACGLEKKEKKKRELIEKITLSESF